MYKNQLQELAQRSCFNLPSYTCIREGPDHAPRFKAAVNFNGETFESPSYCSTLRQAEHSAAEMALDALANRGPSNSLAARILDETGVYKNLLQEVSQRVGATLPVYTTFRTGLGHLPVFTCTVELACVIFTGEPAKNKKQAEKNAAMAAWLSLKSLVQQSETPYERTLKDEQEHVTVARALQKYLIKAKLARASFPIRFPTLNPRPSSTLPPPSTTSKILPLICPRAAQGRPITAGRNNPAFQAISKATQIKSVAAIQNEGNLGSGDNVKPRFQMFPAAGAAPYIPVRCSPRNRVAPPVTIRNAMPVFSAPPLPSPQPSVVIRTPALGMAPPVSLRHAVPVFSAPVRMEELHRVHSAIKPEDPWTRRSMTARVEEPLISKLRPVQVGEPLAPKLLTVPATPTSEVPAVQIEFPSPQVIAAQVPKVCDPSTSSNIPAEERKIEEAPKLPESIDIVSLEDLNI